LKEFDRLIDSIKVNGVPIADIKIERISQDEINRIKKLKDEGKIPGSIRVRDGMRFVPALLFGFLFSLL
jgi:prepilin signal peptidase PulO-like enzyme (type II secretory pathway)